MADLTPKEVAAEDGAYDSDADGTDLLSPEMLAMAPIEFIRAMASEMPTRTPGDYGVDAAWLLDRLGAYADEHRRREADEDATLGARTGPAPDGP